MLCPSADSEMERVGLSDPRFAYDFGDGQRKHRSIFRRSSGISKASRMKPWLPIAVDRDEGRRVGGRSLWIG